MAAFQSTYKSTPRIEVRVWLEVPQAVRRKLLPLAQTGASDQGSKKVRDLVLPAPKTPATARVDLPDLRASAWLEASEATCPLLCRAAVPRALAKVAA